MLLCTQRDYIEKNIWDEKIFQWYTTQKSDTQCSAALLGQTLCHLTWTGSNWFLLSQFLLDIIVTRDILRDANDDQPNDDQDSEFTVNAVAWGKIFHYVTMSGHTYVPEIEFSQILFLFKLFKIKVGNCKNADQERVVTTSLSLHLWCSTLFTLSFLYNIFYVNLRTV